MLKRNDETTMAARMRASMKKPDVEIIECPHRVMDRVDRPENLATRVYEQSPYSRYNCN